MAPGFASAILRVSPSSRYTPGCVFPSSIPLRIFRSIAFGELWGSIGERSLLLDLLAQLHHVAEGLQGERLVLESVGRNPRRTPPPRPAARFRPALPAPPRRESDHPPPGSPAASPAPKPAPALSTCQPPSPKICVRGVTPSKQPTIPLKAPAESQATPPTTGAPHHDAPYSPPFATGATGPGAHPCSDSHRIGGNCCSKHPPGSGGPS